MTISELNHGERFRFVDSPKIYYCLKNIASTEYEAYYWDEDELRAYGCAGNMAVERVEVSE